MSRWEELLALVAPALAEADQVAAEAAPTLTQARPSAPTEAASRAAEEARPTQASFVWSDGSRYDGDVIDGELNGNGEYVWPDGSHYEGEFLNGNPHGMGIYSWPDGSQYIGEFREGNVTGNGEYLWPDGGSGEASQGETEG